LHVAAFWLLTALALISAGIVLFGRNSVICGLALAFNLVTVAGYYFLLGAQFIAFVQVIVYAGAIMVLILFVLMLLNVRDEERLVGQRLFQGTLGLAGSALLLLMLLGVAWALGRDTQGFPEVGPGFGTVRSVGTELFTRFYYPFEAISILLVVAMVGAVLLAKRRL
jgi:NADH-quinone oxidoreductase subunit J